MRKTLLYSISILLISTISGCQSAYWNDRGNDCLDIFYCSYGRGIGVKPRIGPIAVSPIHFYEASKGFRGGESYSNCEGDIDSSYIMPFTYLEGFRGGKNAYERNKSYTAKGAIIFTIPENYSGSNWINFSFPDEFNLNEKPKLKQQDCYSKKTSLHPYSYYTDVEILLALGGGIKAGCNPGELLDFIIGWTTIDIYGDDIGTIDRTADKQK